MASLCSNQVRDCCNFSSSNTRRGFSKAQACLHKILHIISSIHPPPNPQFSLKDQPLIANRGVDDGLLTESNGTLFGEKRGFDIDLNLTLLSPCCESGDDNRSESLAENEGLSACSVVGKPRIIESDLSVNGDKRRREVIEEKTTECYCSSDITNFLQVQSGEDENEIVYGNGESKIQTEDKDEEENTEGLHEQAVVETAPLSSTKDGNGNDCYLSLLIAAAELISSTESPSQDNELTRDDDEEDGKKTTGTDTIKNESEWTAGGVDNTSSPVVGSKRGRRSHVLPQRYRDSVVLLEPWKKPKTTKRCSKGRGN